MFAFGTVHFNQLRQLLEYEGEGVDTYHDV